jgi:hypothetical protein
MAKWEVRHKKSLEKWNLIQQITNELEVDPMIFHKFDVDPKNCQKLGFDPIE